MRVVVIPAPLPRPWHRAISVGLPAIAMAWHSTPRLLWPSALPTCTLRRARPAFSSPATPCRCGFTFMAGLAVDLHSCTGHWAASPSSRIYGSFAGVVDSACRAHRAFGRCNCKKRKTTTTTVVLVPGEREREAALPVEAGARRDRRAQHARQ